MRKALKYITDMKRLPFVLILVVGGIFFGIKSFGKNTSTPPGKYETILRYVSEIIAQAHFSPKEINDAFSIKIFDRFMNDMDDEKNIFLRADVDSLKNLYGKTVDDEMKGAKITFCFETGILYDKRLSEAKKYIDEILKSPFDFTVKEKAELNADKLPFAKNIAELNERWRKKLKYSTLIKYVDLIETREKNKGKDSFVVKTNKVLELEAREKTQKEMNRIFERLKTKFDKEDKFEMYVNSIVMTMDPHSQFMPPLDKRYFDEEISGTFFGIGATLQYEEGNIKITSVMNGTPAAKSGKLQAGDLILKVGQGNAEPVDVSGFLVSDAVKIIRGNKGTEVRLTVKKIDGSTIVVSMIRDAIDQQQTFARSAVINSEEGKIGFIYLPDFYANFDDQNGRRSYVDVAKEIEKLKKQNVDGIIMDLRNNGGGSLYDVIQIAGLFIKDGPIVQVKDRQDRPTVLNDKDQGVLYTGPLAVMVNEFSASASEIFAAAIQDYGRGIILGSTSTYGKGTVQRNIGLDPRSGFDNSNSELGTIKLTLQKFYRINGQSTQLKGVVPDVILPDQYEYLKVREKDEKDALPWDEISKSKYSTWISPINLKDATQKAQLRVKSDSVFNLLTLNAKMLGERNDKQYSLNYDEYKAENKQMQAYSDKLDAMLKNRKDNNINPMAPENGAKEPDETTKLFQDLWIKSLKKDIYLSQAVSVIKDMISQENLAQTKPSEVKAN